MVSVTWRIPIRCTRSLMSKTFRPVTITYLLLNPEIRQRRYCQNVRTTTFPLIVPGRLQSSMQKTGQSTMCMAMTITSTQRWGEVETWMEQQEYPHWHTLSKSSSIQSEQHYPAFTRDNLFFPRNRKHALDMNYKHWVNFHLLQIMSVSSQIARTFIQSSWPITWTFPFGILSRWCLYTVPVLQSN